MSSGAALYSLIGQPGAARNPVYVKSEADSNNKLAYKNSKQKGWDSVKPVFFIVTVNILISFNSPINNGGKLVPVKISSHSLTGRLS